MLTQLIYHSLCGPGESGALNTVRDIIQVSEINNARDRITGFLIFDKSHFVQILEGEAADLRHTLDRIKNDRRHHGLTVLADRAIDARAFSDWAMGGYIRSPESQSIYSKHGIAGDLQTETVSADTIVALASDLLAFETERLKHRVVGLHAHD